MRIEGDAAAGMGANILDFMREGESLDQVAARGVVPLSNLTRIINRQVKNPSLNTVIRISRALGVSVSDLIGETPVPIEAGPMISSTKVTCYGVNENVDDPLRGGQAFPTVTLFESGDKQVFCQYLNTRTGMCRAGEAVGKLKASRARCLYLQSVK